MRRNVLELDQFLSLAKEFCKHLAILVVESCGCGRSVSGNQDQIPGSGYFADRQAKNQAAENRSGEEADEQRLLRAEDDLLLFVCQVCAHFGIGLPDSGGPALKRLCNAGKFRNRKPLH